VGEFGTSGRARTPGPAEIARIDALVRGPPLLLVSLAMKASPADVAAICSALPEVELGTSWGGRPTYKVPRGPKGKGFVIYRRPDKTAVDSRTGEMFTDLLVITVPDEDSKASLVQDPNSPFFTIDHFNGYNAVLVQESRLGEIDRDVLAEILTEAWASKAPRRLVREYFADRPSLSPDGYSAADPDSDHPR
jgi:hypothetical protein